MMLDAAAQRTKSLAETLDSLTGKLGKFRRARNVLSACLRLSSERQGFALCQIFIFIFNLLRMSFLLGFFSYLH